MTLFKWMLVRARVPNEGDPVLALPTTPGVSSTLSGSSPCCLLDVRFVRWGLEEAIFATKTGGNTGTCIVTGLEELPQPCRVHIMVIIRLMHMRQTLATYFIISVTQQVGRLVQSHIYLILLIHMSNQRSGSFFLLFLFFDSYHIFDKPT